MRYRIFNNIGEEVSALGFGCMRLPVKGPKSEIDEPLAIEMIHHAVERGVDYIDTAYPYHGGNSERVVGKALQNGYRQKVKLATKMPVWDVNEYGDFDRFFSEQLQKLRTDRIDFYLLHNLKKQWWRKLRGLGVLEWCEKAISAGYIGYLGFSFHDSYEVFKEIIDAYDNWTFCQIQYNYVNEEMQAGTKGLEYAYEKGLSIIVMEPLLGGCLANPHESIAEIFNLSEKRRSPVDWALQWLWNKPEISVVLSGMSTMGQVKHNIASACSSGVGTLTPQELELIARVQKKYEEYNPVPCTKCGYCMPCPQGVDIPRNLELYNETIVFNHSSLNKNIYQVVFPEDVRADKCTQCRTCEEQCPQKILISEWMPRIHKELTQKE